MAGEKLIRIMQRSGQMPKEDLTDMVGGTVTSTSPLKIRIDDKAELDEEFFILGTMVREMKITIPGEGVPQLPPTTTSGQDSHLHNLPPFQILLWRGLEVGDRVRMLRVGEGQMFYVIEREVGVQ